MTIMKTFKTLRQWILLLFAILWALFPIMFLVISSFKLPKDMFISQRMFNFKPTIINYINLVTNQPEFLKALGNSALITLMSTAIALIVSFPAGYIFSRYHTKTLESIALFTVAIRMLPPIIITIPLFPVFHSLKLFDKQIIIAILYATFFVSLLTWIIKAFIDAIPKDLEEAALIDGCTRVQAIVKIVVPLAKPAIFAGSVLVIIFSWNEFLFAFMFTGTHARTAPIVISQLMGGFYGVEWGMVFAASVIQVVPILLFVWATSHLVQQGLTMGAIK